MKTDSTPSSLDSERSSLGDRPRWAELDETPLQSDAAPPLTYSVLSLFVATTLIALSVVLLKFAHVFGVLIIFVLVFAIDRVLVYNEHPSQPTIAKGLWGIVMPALCLIYDPGFLHQPWFEFFDSDVFPTADLLNDPKGILLVPPVAVQVLAMVVWLLLASRIPKSDFLFGFFWFGGALAATIGTLMLPISLIGLLFIGIGLIGLTPFFTAHQFFQVAAAVSPKADQGGKRRRSYLQALSGVLCALLLPLSISWLVGNSVGYSFADMVFQLSWPS